MRLTSDLLNAGLVALGISLLIRYYPRRTPLVGVLLALSPMVLFLMAVVTSSGLEISAGFATWCGGPVHRRTPADPACPGDLDGCRRSGARPQPTDEPARRRDHHGRLGPSHRLAGAATEAESESGAALEPVLVAAIVAGGFLVAVGRLASPAPHRSIQPASSPTCGRTCGSPGFGSASASGTSDGSTRRSPPGSSSCGPRRRRIDRPRTDAVGTLSTRPPRPGVVDPRHAPSLWIRPDEHRLCLVAGKVMAPGGGRVPPGGLDLPMAITPHSGIAESTEQWVAPALVLGVGAGASRRPGCVVHRALTRYEVGLGVPAGSPTSWLPPGGHYPVVVAFVVGAVVTLALVVFVVMSPRYEGRSHDRARSCGIRPPALWRSMIGS